jgi:hypothetical protein
MNMQTLKKQPGRRRPHKMKDLAANKDPKGGPTGNNWYKTTDAANAAERNYTLAPESR